VHVVRKAYPHEQDFVESYYKVQSDKLTSHLRIVQLSDLHLREFGENNCDLVGAGFVP